MLGDCTLTRVGVSGSNYNFCVKAHRRTVFTNLDRVFTMQFLVRLPPAWLALPAYSITSSVQPESSHQYEADLRLLFSLASISFPWLYFAML